MNSLTEVQPAAFTMRAPGICREIRTNCWVSRACEAATLWPEIADLGEIPEETLLPSGEIVRFLGFSAVWDTGAISASAITDRVIQRCGLKPIGPAKVTQAIGRIAPYESELYRVNIGLPNHLILEDLIVVRAQATAGADVVIGMDIISLGDFSITNKDQKTVFSFRIPSLAATDFVEESGGILRVLGSPVGISS